MSRRRIDLLGATSIVIANMIGTGVFTSLGYQLVDTTAGFPVLAIWLGGGLLAFTGAVCYAELATRMPENGGEYRYLSEIYHPALGFMAGFTSATVGFAAPVAMAALALAGYLAGAFPGIDEKATATVVLLAVSGLHAADPGLGLAFQKIATLVKIAVILIFVALGFSDGNTRDVAFNPLAFRWDQTVNAALAVNLMWVSFAYSGWNASAYLAGEIRNPERNISRSLLYGTLIVTALYIALNAAFLMAAPSTALRGVKEVGLVASTHLFGAGGGRIMGCVIAALLVSSISSMMIAGPRIVQALFAGIPLLRMIAASDSRGSPARGILFQMLLALALLHSFDFSSLLYYIAFTLSLFTVLTVAGVIVLRFRYGRPDGYRAFAYPLSPLLFVGTTVAIGLFFAAHHPVESAAGLSTALFGWAMYRVSDVRLRRRVE